jgi:hypothetical protein
MRRRTPADEGSETTDRPSADGPSAMRSDGSDPGPFVEVHPDAPTVVPPQLDDPDPPSWSLHVPEIPRAPRSPALQASLPPRTLAPSAAPPTTSLPASLELEGGDELRKLRDGIIEQMVRLPLEQLLFCRHELEALHAALTHRWRGVLREALEWATAAHRAGYERSSRSTQGRSGPQGVDVVARVRQHAWWLSIGVPGALSAELVNRVMPRLLEARRSTESVPPAPTDPTAAVRWLEREMQEPQASDVPGSPSGPARNSHRK